MKKCLFKSKFQIRNYILTYIEILNFPKHKICYCICCFAGADVNRATSTNDHTVLSLACAGGHLAVVELLLAHGADPIHKLKVHDVLKQQRTIIKIT